MNMELLTAVQNAGIVGAGGAGFPTHVKLNAKADTVVINAAECEPLLRVDQQLCDVKAEELLTALDMIVAHVGAERGIVAIKEHYHNAVTSLNGNLAKHPKLSLCLMGSFYPAGDEQITVYEATGRIVPEGGIPLNVGVVVTNVETALSVLDAATTGAPVIEKYVTIGGAVVTPKTVKVPLGITVAEVLAMAGGTTVPTYSVINGGPMMGKIVGTDSVITKTTKGLLVIPEGHSLLNSLNLPLQRSLKNGAIACMQCSLCTEVCPRANLGHRLAPHKLMRVAAYGSLCDPKDTPMNAFLCCGCRLCEYACVMQLQPWKVNANLKSILGQNGIRNSLNAKPESANPFRETKRYPIGKLIVQLGIQAYNVEAPLDETAYQATKVVLPLQQGVGAPATPIVSVGDQVVKGQQIAQIPEGKLGAALHASMAGTVTAVEGGKITIQA